MVVTADPAIGLPEDLAMWLDMHQGECRACTLVSREEAEKAAFVLVASYARWKEVIRKQLDPTKGMMQNKLKLTKGHMPTMVKYVSLEQGARRVDDARSDALHRRVSASAETASIRGAMQSDPRRVVERRSRDVARVAGDRRSKRSTSKCDQSCDRSKTELDQSTRVLRSSSS